MVIDATETRPQTERRLHRALAAWAADHAARYPSVTVSDYQPSIRPEQRIDAFKTPLDERIPLLPREQRHVLMWEHYDVGLGNAGRAVVAAFMEPPGGSPKGRPVVQELIDLLRLGKSVALLSPHADRLEDIGIVAAALAIAMEDPRLLMRNGLILNKVMTRELFKGVPMVDMFRPFGNIYWVIPDTASTERWAIPDDVKRYINLNAMRALLGDIATGSLVTFAPTGTLMQRVVDRNGALEGLHIPPIARGSLNLIARFDAYLVTAQWRDQFLLGPITPVSPSKQLGGRAKKRDANELLEEILGSMATLTERLAGVPVSYSSAVA
jgi:hypothetical protein